MADRGQKSALQRKAELARARLPRHAAPPEFGARPGKALVRALKRAGMPLDALMLEPRDPTIALDQTLAEVTEMLPEGGLLVVLEGPDRTRGLLHLHQALLDGLIEVQTTGSVDSTDGPARPATRIDAALSREFIDAALSGLQTELEDAGLPTFVTPLKFGTALEDRRQLPLLLPERGFSLFRVSVDMANGIKAGTALIALPPGEPAAMRGDRAEPDATWQAAFRASVVQARVPLVSVLFRRSMPIQAILALQAGDVIAFEHDALNTVRVEDSLQRAVLKGRLGQAGGKRALRLTLGATDSPPASDLDQHAPPVPPPSPPVELGDMPAPSSVSEDDPLASGFLPPEGGDLPGLAAGGVALGDGDLPFAGDGALTGDGALASAAELDLPLPAAGDPGALGDASLPPLGEGGLPPLGETGLPPLGKADLPPLRKAEGG